MLLTLLVTSTANSEPVQQTFWQIIQDAASFGLTLVTLGAVAGVPVYKWLKRKRAQREAEREAEQQRRKQEMADQIEAAVGPLRETVQQIHHTTHVNGGKSPIPTLRDEVSKVGARVDQCISAIGAVAVNQANLSARQDQAERMGREYVALARAVFAEHDIDLPNYGE